MAEQLQVPQRPTDAGGKGILLQKGTTTAQVLAVVTLLPVGGVLLGLAGMTFIGTLIGLAVTSPLFVIFSPILVPAVIAIGFAVIGFLTSGAFGITALSSLSWIVNYLRSMTGSLPEHVDQAKRRVQDTAAPVGQKAREVGQRGQETVRS